MHPSTGVPTFTRKDKELKIVCNKMLFLTLHPIVLLLYLVQPINCHQKKGSAPHYLYLLQLKALSRKNVSIFEC